MADQVFKQKIKDGSSKQDFLLWLNGNTETTFNGYFSGNDGEIHNTGITISTMDNNSDLRFGSISNPMLVAPIINTDKAYSKVVFNEIKAYAGVRTSTTQHQNPQSWQLKLTIPLTQMYVLQKDDGVYVNDMVDSETEEYAERKISSEQAYSLIGWSSGASYEKDSIVKIFTESGIYSIKANLSTKTFGQLSSVELMSEYLMMKPIDQMVSFYSFDGERSSYVDSKELYEEWCYELIGDFNSIEKSCTNEIMTISATTFSTKIDDDATNLVTGFVGTYGAFFQRLVQDLGVQIKTTGLEFLSETFPYESFRGGQYTYRNVFEIIAEKYGYFVRQTTILSSQTQVRAFEFVKLTKSTQAVETIPLSNIAQGTLLYGDDSTTDVDGLVLRSSGGTSLSIGGSINKYIIYGNPLISAPTQAYLTMCASLPNYYATTLREIYSDPSINLYDMISAMYGTPQNMYIDNVDNALVDENNVAFAVETETYNNFPIMSIEMLWNGRFTSTYSCCGDAIRSESVADNSAYNASINYVDAFNSNMTQLDVFNKLTNNGETQGIYIQNNKLYINADYVKSGTIDAERVGAGSFTITGGSINIDATSPSETSKIHVGYHASGNRFTNVGYEGITTRSDLAGQSGEVTINGGGVFAGSYLDSSSGRLLKNGLNFYNSSGTQTASYPSVFSFGGIGSSGWNILRFGNMVMCSRVSTHIIPFAGSSDMWGNMYCSSVISGIDYPVTFSQTPCTNVSIQNTSAHACILATEPSSVATNTHTCAFQVLRPTMPSGNSVTITLNIIAWGYV